MPRIVLPLSVASKVVYWGIGILIERAPLYVVNPLLRSVLPSRRDVAIVAQRFNAGVAKGTSLQSPGGTTEVQPSLQDYRSRKLPCPSVETLDYSHHVPAGTKSIPKKGLITPVQSTRKSAESTERRPQSRRQTCYHGPFSRQTVRLRCLTSPLDWRSSPAPPAGSAGRSANK